MTRRRSDGGASDDPAAVGDIQLQDAPSGLLATIWDRVLVGLFGLALAGGLAIAIGNAISQVGGAAAAPLAETPKSMPPSVEASSVPSVGPKVGSWGATAVEHRGENRNLIRHQCASSGSAFGITGTGVYTDDSSICTAAVHIGLLTFEDGGVVTIQVLPTIDWYVGSRHNGVTSHELDAQAEGSFVFADIPAPSWATAPSAHRGENGQRFAYDCSPYGRPLPVWGTRVYTDDSSVCTAAVQMGLIRYENGGRVTIEIRRGREAYLGTTRNGVVSDSWDAWDGSFVFVT